MVFLKKTGISFNNAGFLAYCRFEDKDYLVSLSTDETI
jgi:hypothetical protein